MFPAFLYTCTLYGAYLCDSLLRLAEVGTCRPLWSAGVLDELGRVLLGPNRPSEFPTFQVTLDISARMEGRS